MVPSNSSLRLLRVEVVVSRELLSFVVMMLRGAAAANDAAPARMRMMVFIVAFCFGSVVSGRFRRWC